mmetsp:Transcript_26617/g.49985  ORF Transcript_26617/g.49985 Transcript_26617/m.49985 type:complete len:152 (+) Transcript_26617:63-518(+)
MGCTVSSGPGVGPCASERKSIRSDDLGILVQQVDSDTLELQRTMSGGLDPQVLLAMEEALQGASPRSSMCSQMSLSQETPSPDQSQRPDRFTHDIYVGTMQDFLSRLDYNPNALTESVELKRIELLRDRMLQQREQRHLQTVKGTSRLEAI